MSSVQLLVNKVVIYVLQCRDNLIFWGTWQLHGDFNAGLYDSFRYGKNMELKQYYFIKAKDNERLKRVSFCMEQRRGSS